MSGATDASLRCQIMGGRLCVLHSGKIFDLTDFAEKHPGGKEVLEKHVGKDVTQVMRSEDVHKHSQAAYNIMDRYYIGEYNGVNGVVSIFYVNTCQRMSGMHLLKIGRAIVHVHFELCNRKRKHLLSGLSIQ